MHRDIITAINGYADMIDQLQSGLQGPGGPAGSSGQGFVVDLREPPYNVVANDSSKATPTQNVTGINAAITAYSGTGAILQLPVGEIYVERADSYWSVRFYQVSNVTLRGMGMFATTLIQQGVGVANSEWDAIVIDHSDRITVCDLGVKQGTITNPDFPGDHHALINTFASTGHTTNVVCERIWFGPCIGDAFRLVGNGDIGYHVEKLKLLDFVMETYGHPWGAGGLGVGSRSGVSFQRGLKNVEIGHGFIKGAKNSPFEMEPSGVGIQDNVLIHDLVVDNPEGSTRLAFTVAGSVTNPISRLVVNNVIVLEGAVQCAHTVGMICDNVQVYTSSSAPAELTNNSLFFLHQDHLNATISNLHLYRDTGSPRGPLVMIIPAGQATGTITPPAGSGLVDGETFTISDGVTTKVLEFDNNASVTGGLVGVKFTGADTATQVRDAIVTAVNGAGLNITASNTTVRDGEVLRPAALLTNKHHGQHGNVPITETVADTTFLVAGMANGIGGTSGARFSGGHWVSKVTAGSERRYIDVRGCERVSFEDVNVEVWANTTSEYGFVFRSIGDVNSPSINNCRIDSRSTTFGATGNKLEAAAIFANTNAYMMRDIRVTGLRAPSACTSGVVFDLNSGSGIDATPIMQGCDFTGSTNAWAAINGAVGIVFPIIAGNRSGICTMIGTVAPESVVAAIQGCEYIRQNGNSTTKYFKSTGTGSTGWSQMTIP